MDDGAADFFRPSGSDFVGSIGGRTNMDTSEWSDIPGLPGKWRTGRTERPKTNLKAKATATAVIKAADQGTVITSSVRPLSLKMVGSIIAVFALLGGGLWLFVQRETIKDDKEKGTSFFLSHHWSAAQSYLEASAERGDRLSQSLLGDMFREGCASSPPPNFGLLYPRMHCAYPGRDLRVAAKWERRAAEQGSRFSQYQLGLMYSRGEGVPKDDVLAYMWLNLASAAGDADGDREKAAKAREEVARALTPAQIGEAQKLAREWKPERESGYKNLWVFCFLLNAAERASRSMKREAPRLPRDPAPPRRAALALRLRQQPLPGLRLGRARRRGRRARAGRRKNPMISMARRRA
jgi:hypothetical protein